jgi:RHS repeat-associated protein
VLSGAGKAAGVPIDPNGNLCAEGVTTCAGSNPTKTYEWDAENRLTAINAGTLRSEFSYDGYGRRVRIVEKLNGNITSNKTFLWCDLEICEERDAAGTTVTKQYFAHGVRELVGGPTNYFYTRDHLGSIRELTDTAGLVKARYDYDVWGRRTTLGTPTKEADFAFTGHYNHSVSGLALAPYRAYDAGLARWISEDPLGLRAGTNLYRYVRSNPLRYIDPLGGQEVDVPVPNSPKPPPPRPPRTPKVTPKPPTPQRATVITRVRPIVRTLTRACGVVLTIIEQLIFSETVYAPDNNPDEDRCAKEWEEAYEMCEELLKRPNPPRGITGGYTNLADCARGLVSEECGGNPVK